jgi:outer membrane protein assembly factor BamD (BamD/ComL family)
MHWEAFSFFDEIHLSSLIETENPSVLDIGSYDVNGCLRGLISSPNYVGLDLMAGPNVDAVASGADYTSSSKFELTLSCECFEHNPHYMETFENMVRLTKPGGLVVFTCATTGREEHGTARTTPYSSIASNETYGNYYKNLTKSDFAADYLQAHFSEWLFFTNHFSSDLYFIGHRDTGSLSYQPERLLIRVPEIVAGILNVSENLSLIERHIENNENSEAYRIIELLLGTTKKSYLLLVRIMNYLIELKEYEKCIALGKEAYFFDFNQANNLYLQGKASVLLGDFDSAYSILSRMRGATKIMNPKSVLLLADVAAKLGRYSEGIERMKESLENFPNFSESDKRIVLFEERLKLQEAKDAINAGDLEKAYSLLSTMHDQSTAPRRQSVIMLADVAYKLAKYDEAFNLVEKNMDRFPDCQAMKTRFETWNKRRLENAKKH